MSADRLQELHDRFAARLGTRLSELRECIDASRRSSDE